MAGLKDRKTKEFLIKNLQKKVSSTLPAHPDKNLSQPAPDDTPEQKPVELGGPKGPEPTRYGDWEKAGRCSDF
jgi:hypothetical protein